ncbi:hypothetical protein [Fischerella sp. JS2]|uniref:hypothetical protein n=1 Tax=Fischerella sp. JS2 TaxID=2597771 RepID=UPI0028EB7239|nr:hypothetical protein [Fischerella sp. JS2]
MFVTTASILVTKALGVVIRLGRTVSLQKTYLRSHSVDFKTSDRITLQMARVIHYSL